MFYLCRGKKGACQLHGYHTADLHLCFPISVHSFSRRNLFILNKFLISGKILITCWELYFEVVGHVYLIRMRYFPENEIFFLSKIMSKMTHIHKKTKIIAFRYCCSQF